MIAFLQGLFSSRYCKHLEQELTTLKAELSTTREQLAQITSNLLVGAGMPGIDLSKREVDSVPKHFSAPSLWRKKMELQDRNKISTKTKENN